MRLRPIAALEDNYIWVLDDGKRAVVVDPGDASPVLACLQRDALELDSILLTHHHADHTAGAVALTKAFPAARVIGPDDRRIAGALERVAEGASVRMHEMGLAFEVLEIPGHTLSHIAFVGEGMLFCGDTLFSLGCGRMFEGSPEQFHHSLSRLAGLGDDLLVCCGHEYTEANAAFALAVDAGNRLLVERRDEVLALRKQGRSTLPSRLAHERASNPFLRCNAPEIRKALTARSGSPPTDEVQAFAQLRAWKDNFRPAFS